MKTRASRSNVLYNYLSVVTEIGFSLCAITLISEFSPATLQLIAAAAAFQTLISAFHLPLVDAVTIFYMRDTKRGMQLHEIGQFLIVSSLPYLIAAIGYGVVNHLLANSSTQPSASFYLITIYVADGVLRSLIAILQGYFRAKSLFKSYANISALQGILQTFCSIMILIFNFAIPINAFYSAAFVVIAPDTLTILILAVYFSTRENKIVKPRQIASEGIPPIVRSMFWFSTSSSVLSPLMFASLLERISRQPTDISHAAAVLPVLIPFLLSFGFALNTTMAPRFGLVCRRGLLCRSEIYHAMLRLLARIAFIQVAISLLASGGLYILYKINFAFDQQISFFLIHFVWVTAPSFVLFIFCSFLMRILSILGQGRRYFLCSITRVAVVVPGMSMLGWRDNIASTLNWFSVLVALGSALGILICVTAPINIVTLPSRVSARRS